MRENVILMGTPMAQSENKVGRFERITMEEVNTRGGAVRDPVFTTQLQELFENMGYDDPFEMALKPDEKYTTIRARIIRYADTKEHKGVKVRKGTKDGKTTVIVYRER